MQIVIEIEDYDKEWITNGYYIPNEINGKITEAIINGTPLPEHHGRLIDADVLQNDISHDKREAFTKHDVWLFPSIYNKRVPTIIEADKEVDG